MPLSKLGVVAWAYINPVLGKQGQEDSKFKVILSHTVKLEVSLAYVRPDLK